MISLCGVHVNVYECNSNIEETGKAYRG